MFATTGTALTREVATLKVSSRQISELNVQDLCIAGQP